MWTRYEKQWTLIQILDMYIERVNIPNPTPLQLPSVDSVTHIQRHMLIIHRPF
jgi:hypothetical protein